MSRRNQDEQCTGEEKSPSQQTESNPEWLWATIHSIGDGVIATDIEGAVTFLNPVAEALTGWPAEDAVGQPLVSVFRIVDEQTGEPLDNPIHKVLRQEVTTELAGPAVLIARDGTTRAIDDSAAPIQDVDGRTSGVVLVFRDVSQKRAADRRRNARLAVTQILASETSIDKAIPDVLSALCSALAWDIAGFWQFVPGENKLRCRDCRCRPGRDFEAFVAAMRGLAFRLGESLPGQAWEQGAPVWSRDAARNPHFLRTAEAQKVGLHGAFACPVTAGSKFLGVLECFSREIRDPDEDLLEMMATISGQVGQFLERRHAAEKLRESEQRFRTLADAAPVLIWVSGAKKEGIYFNQTWLDFTGRTIEQERGEGWLERVHPDDADILAAACEDAFRNQTSFTAEFRLERADGEYRWLLDTGSPRFDPDGNFAGFIGSCVDITERKRAGEAEALLAAVVKSSDDAIISKTIDGIIMSWNIAAERIYGYTAAEAIGRPITIIVPPELYDEEQGFLERLRRGEQIAHFETVRVAKDGRRINVSLTISPVRDSGNRIIGASKVSRDITERRQAEKALRESEERFRALGENIPQLAWMAHPDGRIFWFNRRWFEYTGTTLEDVQGWGWQSIHHPEHAVHAIPKYKGAIRTGEPWEDTFPLRAKDGEYRWFLSRAFPIRDTAGKITCWFGTHTDITELLTTQEALRKSQERLEIALEASGAATWGWNVLDNRVDEWSPQYRQLYGFSAEEPARLESWLNRIHPEDRARLQRRINEMRNTPGDDSWNEEFRVEHPEKGIRWITGIGRCTREETGQIAQMSGVNLDITKRKQMEQSLAFLAEASKSLASLTDYKSTLQKVAQLAVPAFADWCAVDLRDHSGSIQRLAVAHVDPAKVALAEELLRRYPPNLDAPRGVMQVLRTGESDMAHTITEEMMAGFAQNEMHLKILRKLTPVSYMCLPLKNKETTFGVMTFVWAESGRHYGLSDLSLAEELARRAAIAIENARLYQEVQEADRRKDEFLAMLAHELRNPLAPIRSGLDILAMDPHHDHDVVDVMQEQVEHVVRLVDDLLDVSRIMRGKIELRKEPAQLSALVKQSVEAIRPLVESHEQELFVSLPDEPIWLLADPVRLLQIFENLLTNAAKYTEPGGRIGIVAEVHGEQAVVKVEDTGVGIEPELLPNVFELFTQSTRSLDRAKGGLGIGLTLVRRLVELHEGTVTVHSEGPGHGSTFIVRLPIAHFPEDATGEIPTTESIQNQRILVVDDNVGAALLLSKLLEKLGDHEVEVAHEGVSALAKIEDWPPDLVLLDIGLPGMNGYEVAETIRSRPEFDDVLLVALTGYGQKEDREKSKQAGFDEHQVKPPSLDQLKSLLAHPKLESRQAHRTEDTPAAERPRPALSPAEKRGREKFQPAASLEKELREIKHDLGNVGYVLSLIVEMFMNPSADAGAVNRARDAMQEEITTIHRLVKTLEQMIEQRQP